MTFGGRLATAGLGGLFVCAALCAALPGGAYVLAGLLSVSLGIAARDRYQSRDPLLRNYPLLGRLHGGLHLAGKLLGWKQPLAPYDWALMELVQDRAEGKGSISAFGAQLPSPRVSLLHAVQPAPMDRVPERIVIGGGQCAQPYSASYLNISALAFGAISERAIEALGRGAKEGDFFYNTGEAGLPDTFLLSGSDLVWQLGTGYFGCRDRSGHYDDGAFREKAALDAVKMIEVKLSQGAKPAKGGLLPGEKVTARVAEVCQIPAGEDSVLPATHSAFSSPVGLLEFLAKLRASAGGKPVGFKLCVGRASDVFAIAKAIAVTGLSPDFISVDGAEGGTGAAPVEFQSFVGMPLGLALPLVRDALVGCGVREQVKIIASGKITTGADMVAALAAGADLCAAARPFMIALGCMQALICASNRCPVGITTQDPRLTRGIVPRAQASKVARYHAQTVLAFRELVSALGCTPSELGPGHLLPAARTTELEPGQLLAGSIPREYESAWRAADPERF
ncbi:MAG: FMN-binding glutamate synthase family protein [Kofleriaceae bacterium]